MSAGLQDKRDDQDERSTKLVEYIKLVKGAVWETRGDRYAEKNSESAKKAKKIALDLMIGLEETERKALTQELNSVWEAAIHAYKARKN